MFSKKHKTKNKKTQKTKKTVWKDENRLYILTGSLRKAFRKYTSIDLKSDEGQTLLAIHFITQAVPDIQNGLQKLEAGPRAPQAALVSEAVQGFNSQDWTEEARKDNRADKKAQILAAIQGPPQGDPRQQNFWARRTPTPRDGAIRTGAQSGRIL